jgi:GT2 family glycosyltransferase/broad specificity phosphatase PhoE
MSQATEAVGGPVRQVEKLLVGGNRWQELPAPALGAWTPTRTVSVVVPCYDSADELRLTLAALRRQTYPSDLLQVIVVDDGSPEPVKVEEGSLPGELQVIRQEHSGFGAGRARQAGAEAADGDILLFLDADIVADPAHVEAHARWHHLIDDAATMGVRTFVDFTGVEPDEVAAAPERGGVDALLAGRTQQPHEWIENYLARSDDLRQHRGDEWRIVVGASLGVHRNLFRELGALPSFGVRGTEDTALGYRLFTLGAVLIPDREARSWHQGARTLDDPEVRERVIRAREPIMVNEIPDPRFRKPEPGRSYRVPSLKVTVPVDSGTGEDEVVACVGALLASELHDLVVGVTGSDDDAAHRWAASWFADDPRVEVTDEDAWGRAHPYSPFTVTMPPHAVVGPATIRRIHHVLLNQELGALHLTVPGSHPRDGIVHAVRTRALRRAERLAATADDVPALVGQLFGEQWLGGEEFDLDRTERSEAEEAEEIREGRYAGWRAQELAVRLQETERKLKRLQSRRIVAVLNAAGRMRGVKSPRALFSGAKVVLRAALRGSS